MRTAYLSGEGSAGSGSLPLLLVRRCAYSQGYVVVLFCLRVYVGNVIVAQCVFYFVVVQFVFYFVASLIVLLIVQTSSSLSDIQETVDYFAQLDLYIHEIYGMRLYLIHIKPWHRKRNICEETIVSSNNSFHKLAVTEIIASQRELWSAKHEPTQLQEVRFLRPTFARRRGIAFSF
jgi:hypothetical protein